MTSAHVTPAPNLARMRFRKPRPNARTTEYTNSKTTNTHVLGCRSGFIYIVGVLNYSKIKRKEHSVFK
jgi:hypothetical protein